MSQPRFLTTMSRRFVCESSPGTDARARVLRIDVAPCVCRHMFAHSTPDHLSIRCTEQTMSSFLPNVIVSQALKDVKSSSIRSSNDLPKKVQKGLDRLYAYQHNDGGWGWWKDDQSDPFMTAYVVNGLTLARQGGYQPDESRLEADVRS